MTFENKHSINIMPIKSNSNRNDINIDSKSTKETKKLIDRNTEDKNYKNKKCC